MQGVEVACERVQNDGFHWSHSDNGLQNKDEFTHIQKPFQGAGLLFLSISLSRVLRLLIHMFQPSISACSPHAYTQWFADWKDEDWKVLFLEIAEALVA